MVIWADTVSKDTMHVLFVKKYLLHPTNPWEEDSVYKAQKIFKPKSPISAFEEGV